MDTSDLIQQARAAIKDNNKPQARQLLQQAVRQEPQNYAGWLWLASVAASPAASLEYVKRAERLNPSDPTVQKARRWAERRLPKPTPKSSVVPVSPPPARRWQTWAIGFSAVLLLLCGAMAFWFSSWGSAQTAVHPASNIAQSEPSTDTTLVLSDADEQEPESEPTAPSAVVEEPSSEPELIVPAADATPEPTQRPERVLAKNVNAAEEPRAKWTATPLPTNTPIPTPTLAPTFVAETTAWVGKRPFGVGVNERWIDINLSSQSLSAFEGDTLVFTSIISSGTANHPTVTGQFRTWLKYESQTMDGRRLGYDYYLENVPYVMYFYQDYAIHGAYWHNNFGTPMSHGCVNMNISDSQWLFNWAGIGTLVNVHY